MSKKILLLSIFLFVSQAHSASAQIRPSTDSAKPEIIKERLQNTVGIQPKDNLQIKKDAIRAEFQSKRIEFRAKLLELKDQRKKIIVERIDQKFVLINQSSTSRMNLSIEKLEALLEKFAKRAETAKSEGQDTTEIDTAISNAETAISNAREIVATQAGKQYIAEIEDEATLKNTVGETMKSLRLDLKTTHTAIKDAKQKVIDVARALARLKAITPTISISPEI